MSADDWDDLARLAEAATPGPWQAVTTGRAGGDHWYVTDAGEAIAHISAQDGINEDQRQPDAEFIAAANPATILRLIEDNRRMRHGSLCPECNAKAWGERADFRRERDELAARLAAVEALTTGWAVMAGQAMEADTREWLAAASKSIRAALDGAQ